MKQVIRCLNKEQFDIIKSKCKEGYPIRSASYEKYVDNYRDGICISIDDSSLCNDKYWQEKGYIIISFEDWCKENNYTFTKTYTKDDFVVGKWYEINSISNKWLIKFERFEKNCLWGPHRDLSYTSAFSNNMGLILLQDIKSLKELSIEEVQQYLPTDHPDYIKPMGLPIVDKIYKVEDKSGFWMIGKITDNTIIYYENKSQQNNEATYISKNNVFHKSSEWCYFDKSRTYRLATPEEEAWLEECIKQDKYIDQDKVPKVLSDKELLEEAKKRYPIGGTYKINQSVAYNGDGKVITIKPTKDSDYVIMDSLYDESNYKNISICVVGVFHTRWSIWAEIVEVPKEENLVDRYLKALVDNPLGGSGIKKGDYGKIISKYYVDFPNNKHYSCSHASIYNSEKLLELMPIGFNPTLPKKKLDFTIGDWIRLKDIESYRKVLSINLEKDSITYDQYIDEIGYSKEDCNSICKGLDRMSKIDISEIKHLLPKDSIEDSKWVPKLGDWVVITKSTKNWAEGLNNMDKYIGKCVQITTVFKSNRITFKDDGNWFWGYSYGHFRQALSHEIPQIQVGDALWNSRYTTHKDLDKLLLTELDIFKDTTISTVYMDISKPDSIKEIKLNLPKTQVQDKPLLNIKQEQIKTINLNF